MVEPVFGADGIDFAMLHKIYGRLRPSSGRRTDGTAPPSAPESTCGSSPENPDTTRRFPPAYVERQNLTMRMGMRRFTRLTNGFSKKVENLAHAVSLHYMHYNFARPHSSLGKRVTPAMAAGVAAYPWTSDDIAGLLDD